MTFCLGMKCSEGLLAIADTTITSGTELSVAKKISVHQAPTHSMFILTSGLRSVRDKAITYFEERLIHDGGRMDRMYKAANALTEEIRRVRSEDETWLRESQLFFDLHCILGGQLEGDQEHLLYLIYPEGNWVEIGEGTPYAIIGESRYGKPVLDRVWHYDRPLAEALRAGLISVDATRTSAADVDYPVDCVLYRQNSFQMLEERFTAADVADLSEYWQSSILSAVEGASAAVEPLLQRLEGAPPARLRESAGG